jgi:glycosyl transferase family 87
VPGDNLNPSPRARRRTIPLWLLLAFVWIFGTGEALQFVSQNARPGPYEKNGPLKGRDFLQFYVAGTLARDGNWKALYDASQLEREVARIVPAAAGRVPAPVYGPQLALLFSPLARLPYLEARWIWLALSAAIYLVAAALVIRTAAPLEGYRAFTWITLVSNPALMMVLATGQIGAVATLAWALGAVALAKGRPFLFGVSLGLLAYKPPLLIGALAALLAAGQWGVVMGALVSVAGQWSAAMLVTGPDPWKLYFQSLARLPEYYALTNTMPQHKQSLSGFFELLVGPGAAVAVLTALAVAGVLALWWNRRGNRLTMEFVPMLAATSVLLSPHFYVYDLVMLMPALLIVAERLRERCETQVERLVGWCGYVVLFLGPFAGPLALRSRVQLSTVALVGLVLAIYKLTSPQSEGTVAAEARVPQTV